MGEDFFAAAAQRFIVASPPRAADLNQYGEGFADFLASFEAAASVPYLPDVARLEWAVNRALHAPPAPPLTPEALRAVPAEQQADLRFVAHPTLSLLSLDYPARAIWEAVLTEDDDERAARLADHRSRIRRRDTGRAAPRRRARNRGSLRPAFELAQALTGGCPLGDALEHVAAQDAAPLLADFLARGFFAGFSLPAEDAPLTQGSMLMTSIIRTSTAEPTGWPPWTDPGDRLVRAPFPIG